MHTHEDGSTVIKDLSKQVHYHFIVWASKTKEGDNYKEVTYLDFIMPDSDINKAIVRAKEICPNKGNYRVNNVAEHHSHEFVKDK